MVWEQKQHARVGLDSCGSIFSCTVNKVLYWFCPQEIQRTRVRPTRTWMGHRSRIYGHQTDLFDDQFNSKMLRPWLPIFFHRFMIYLIFDVGFCRCRMFFLHGFMSYFCWILQMSYLNFWILWFCSIHCFKIWNQHVFTAYHWNYDPFLLLCDKSFDGAYCYNCPHE